jgi:uncharacterized membrane protein
MKDRILAGFSGFFKDRFIATEEINNQEGIIENIRSGVEFRGARLWSVIIAALIACVGITIKMPVIIFGAMIIAPLTGPLAGMGAGLAVAGRSLGRISATNFSIITVFGFLASYLYFLLMPAPSAEGWYMRTAPGIWDVLVSLLAGFVVVLSGHGRRNGFVIAGAAVSTVLLPPLCTMGLYAASGTPRLMLGAMFLYLTSTAFIVMGCFLMMRASRFRRLPADQRTVTILRVITILFILSGLVIIYMTTMKEVFKSKVQRFIDKEISSKNLYVVARSANASAEQVALVLYGAKMHDSTLNRITTNKRFYGLHDASIMVRYAPDSGLDDSLKIWMSGAKREYNDGAISLNANDLVSRELKKKLAEYDFARIDPAIFREFTALFGETKELAIEKGLIHNERGGTDTCVLIYMRQPPGAVKINLKQVEKWMKARLNMNEVRIMSR